ncbi:MULTISPECIES: two-component system sensor histidine kinase NtrB [Thalassospira]|jgi:two-component system nitrogen regulation sensor histidine kinase GlnL|uniref:histidine kinase n=5 Tax=Thalassospira TaxID=168934 RepID=A0A853KXT5_9PROT|nr:MULTISPECIES: ATP-binding protein [Thalassospira]KXJ58535.1 MAG: PAS domain-containing sensor histidine kinase [Thalassospira sp. Nap_22]OAZ13252.1 ATPase [Thalassospira profundimaris]AXO15001.1 PAS domain-containing sensor histidine kinase [Thalassospira indica]EKF07516.1 Signal transduction histidine kinase [Thalassospira profundimaris WP0211]MBE72002.1 PAS domain-containing sensor histidine kinase [Thalassospira sp.]|tara:strand:- start:416 stop:1561 length:1146 start_codon:yes stop_codon:yes gene_type:complete
MRLGFGKGNGVDPTGVLNAIASAVVVANRDGKIKFVNQATEQLFNTSAAVLCRSDLTDFIPQDSPVFSLIRQAVDEATLVADHNLLIESPKIGKHTVNLTVGSMPDDSDCAVLTFEPRSIAQKIDNQLLSRNSARSVSAMAAILAHEIKNPLSGIRGAAQLLEQTSNEDDRVLTRLICDEADRIVELVDRMEIFSDKPLERGAVNIHTVLEHVRRLAENGFAKNLTFEEIYDPSLPPVFGNRDQLVQVFLNLIKNAGEAVDPKDGVITISTRYQHGIRLAVAGGDARVHLPLVVSVRDNGPGIPQDMRESLFDPFVTTKPTGSGLGLALVAKIINDHGGVIEVKDVPGGGAEFQIMLPIYNRALAEGAADPIIINNREETA